jgi:uncharacterized membrane protein
MTIHQISIAISAPPNAVWRLLSGVAAWPNWLPTVSSVEPLDGETIERGRRFKVLQPKLHPAIWTVSAVEPNQRFEWQATSPGILMIADHVVEVTSPEEVTVLLRFEFRGVIGSLLGLLYASTTRKYIEQEARCLKRTAELAKNRQR